MITQIETVLIVGAGAAGVSAARTLRKLGFEGRLTLVDRDGNGSYERPPLSKKALLDPNTRASDFELLSRDDIADLDLQLVLGDAVTAIDPDDLSVKTASGRTLQAERMLLAMGGAARDLPLEGRSVPGVLTLRDFSDVEKIRDRMRGSTRAAVVGGGLIGAECAASFQELGLEVLWFDAAKEPLVHVLPAAIARRLVKVHVEAGIQLFVNAAISGFEADDVGVSAVRMEDGAQHFVDFVLLGVGMMPLTRLAESAGLDLMAGGIRVCDQQQTSCPGVFAAGDVAALRDRDGWCRHEHWRAAEMQGERAAYGMLGVSYETPDTSWFWSDQGDHHVEMVGKKGARSVLRVQSGGLASFEFDEDGLVGAASINDPTSVRVALRLLRAGKTPPVAALQDPDQDLRQLLRA